MFENLKRRRPTNRVARFFVTFAYVTASFINVMIAAFYETLTNKSLIDERIPPIVVPWYVFRVLTKDYENEKVANDDMARILATWRGKIAVTLFLAAYYLYFTFLMVLAWS